MAATWRRACALVVLAAAVDANAASFDCAKAIRPEQKLVCSDPVLSRLDEQVAESYREARSLVSEPGRSALLAGQRAWLRYWPRDCSSRRGSVVFDATAAACARVRHELRIEALKVDRAFEGKFRVYDVAGYSARWTPRHEDIWVMVVGHSWIYPQIDLAGLAPSDARFARTINAWIAPNKKAIETRLADDLSTSSTRTTLRTVTPGILGATTEADSWGVGAAHSLGSIEHRYFVRKPMRPLRSGDVFVGTEWVSKLRELAFEELKRRLGDDLQVGDPREISTSMSDTRHWVIGREGLGIQFREYEVAAYSVGMPTVTVPWSMLANHLTAFARCEVGLGCQE